MSISRGDNDLIAAIYDSIIDPSGWDEIVKRIVDATKSVAGGIFVQQAGAAHLSAMHNVDPLYANAYVETWHEHNPFDVIAVTAAPGELRTCTYITQTGTTDPRRSSAFFNEFLRPQQQADDVGVGLLRGPPSSIWLSIDRRMRFGWTRRNGSSWRRSRHT